MKFQKIFFFLVFFPLLFLSQIKHHRFRRQAYLQGNTDYIGKGNLGLESTLIFENDFNSPDNFFLPNNDITFGVNENFEFLLGFDSFYNKNSGWGINPLDFGFKYNIFDEDSRIPQIDIICRVQTENLGTKNLALSKTLPMISFYATKNFNANCHAVFDTGLQWTDTSPNPSFMMDFYSEYKIDKKDIINLEINDFSTDQRFLNFIVGIGAERNISDNFSLELNYGKYIKSSNQNYYFSMGFNKIFTLKKK